MLLPLVLLMVLVFGLWGCDSGDGDGANYGYDFTVTIVDNTDTAVAALVADDVIVTTESGAVGAISVTNGVVTFAVDGITKAQNYVTLTVDITGYFPLIRRYLTTVTTKTDTSGDNFRSAVLLFNQIPAGGGADESTPETHVPGTGTSNPITVTGVTAGTGFGASATVGAGLQVATPSGGAVNDTIVMKLTFHQGTSNQEPFYPGGSYGGNAPAAFGTISFMGSTSQSTVVPTGNTQINLQNVTFTITPSSSAGFDYGISDYSSALENTYACIIDVSTGQSVSVSGCTYDPGTGLYTCANGYYTFSAGDAVGSYRLEGGICPTTASSSKQ